MNSLCPVIVLRVLPFLIWLLLVSPGNDHSGFTKGLWAANAVANAALIETQIVLVTSSEAFLGFIQRRPGKVFLVPEREYIRLGSPFLAVEHTS